MTKKTEKSGKSSHPVQVVGRTALRLGQTALISLAALYRYQTRKAPSPQLLRETFEKLGTTYIKLGQLIASSPSLFPREYVEEFQKLLDQTTPVSFDYIQQQLQENLPLPPESIFEFIDPVPLASASIAQVHAARLRTGEEVVIKVQKPGVDTILKTDLNVVHGVLKLLEKVVPKLKMATMSGVVNEIKTRMLLETDFVEEARNIRDFTRFLEQTGNHEVTAPLVYEQASNNRVLTMQRLYGVPMTDIEKMREIIQEPALALLMAMNTWFASIMGAPSFHADLHAGNVMLLRDGRVGFIDFGIVGKLDPSSWQGCIELMEAIQLGDFAKMAPAMVKMGMTHQQVDIEDLTRDLKKLFEGADVTSPEMLMKGDMSEMNALMMDIVQAGQKHGIHFPQDFTLLVKQMLYFDRFMQILTPHMDMFNDQRLNLTPDMPEILVQPTHLLQ